MPLGYQNQECPACRLSQSGTHPDLRLLMPEAMQDVLLVSTGWQAGDGADAAADGEAKAGKRKPSREIRIEAIRSAIDWAHTSSSRGQGKVLLLYPAEAMNAVSANALLKTLEEPAAGTRIILCTRDPSQILPTLRSRCQQFRLPPVPQPMALAWLAAQGLDLPEVMLAAAGGEVLDALALAKAGTDARAWSALPERLLQGDGRGIAEMSIPEQVKTLSKLCHDALCQLAGASPRFFPAASLAALNLKPEESAWKAARQWQIDLQHVARHDEHPWNLGLLHDALVAQARQALSAARGRSRKPHLATGQAAGNGANSAFSSVIN